MMLPNQDDSELIKTDAQTASSPMPIIARAEFFFSEIRLGCTSLFLFSRCSPMKTVSLVRFDLKSVRYGATDFDRRQIFGLLLHF